MYLLCFLHCTLTTIDSSGFASHVLDALSLLLQNKHFVKTVCNICTAMQTGNLLVCVCVCVEFEA